MYSEHYPVMLEETVFGLDLKDNGVYFDGTLGFGGHTGEILKRTTGAKVVATDLDLVAIRNADKLKKLYPDRFFPVHDNFKNFASIAGSLGIESFDGILLDLGVSSVQLDVRERGFSYLGKDEPLDMRFNTESGFSAQDIVNEYTKEQLAKIIADYGEERFANAIANNIAERRKTEKIVTCGQLVDIIVASIPKKFQQNGHPAKKTFQALRIETNGELAGLDKAIKDMVAALKKGGRMAVITFHSLEDRIVKNVFKDLNTDCVCDKSLPICVCGRKKIVELINKKPITASEKELEENSRSKSAKLRIVEKVI
ncbi:MAG: 16S rRNA (cytosine(1402)-N(4))-methyltransferase RsmH [Clostridia bacterium]|nr:16S rRNA (cytosine(1402)-N(4))-methyltransferase RsmH [Clostridia bacterium]